MVHHGRWRPARGLVGSGDAPRCPARRGVLGVRPDGGWSTAAPRGGAGRVAWCSPWLAQPRPRSTLRWAWCAVRFRLKKEENPRKEEEEGEPAKNAICRRTGSIVICLFKTKRGPISDKRARRIRAQRAAHQSAKRTRAHAAEELFPIAPAASSGVSSHQHRRGAGVHQGHVLSTQRAATLSRSFPRRPVPVVCRCPPRPSHHACRALPPRHAERRRLAHSLTGRISSPR